MSFITEALKAVASERSALAFMQSEMDSATRFFEQEHAEEIQAIRESRARLQEAERLARELILANYEETKDKSPEPGAGVRVSVELEYDTARALEFARTECKMLVKEVLDAKGFESIAKGKIDAKAFTDSDETHPEGLDFVTARQKATATIGTDLSSYLNGEA